MEKILARLSIVVIEWLAVDSEDVKLESNFESDLGADSLDLIEMLMAVEEKFFVEITDDQAENIKTVGDAVKLIDELTQHHN